MKLGTQARNTNAAKRLLINKERQCLFSSRESVGHLCHVLWPILPTQQVQSGGFDELFIRPFPANRPATKLDRSKPVQRASCAGA